MKKLQRKSVVWKWALWYLVIMAVLTAANLWLYAQGRRSLLERQMASMELQLDQIGQRAERSIREIEELGNVLVNDSLFKKIAMKRNLEDHLAYDKYLMRQSLSEKSMLNESFTQIFLYFEDQDLIVSNTSTNPSKIYWKLNQKETGISRDVWNLLTKGQFEKITMLRADSDCRENGSVIYVRTLCDAAVNYQKVNLFVVLNPKTMVQITEGSAGRVSFLTRDGAHIQSYGPSLDEKNIQIQQEENFGIVRLNIPDKIFYGSLDQFMAMFILSTVLAVLLCLLLIFCFIRANYRPLQVLLSVLKDGSDGPEEQNEYELALERAQYVMDTRKDLSKTLSVQQKFFREEYIHHLLLGEIPEVPRPDDMQLAGPEYAVLGFCLDEKNEQELEISYFIVRNVYGEILEKAGLRTDWVQRRGLMFAVMNGQKMYRPDLQRLFENADRFLDEKFELDYFIGISQTYHSVTELADAYREVVQVMEFQQGYGIDKFSFYEDFVENTRSSYYYPIAQEQELLSAIRRGDVQEARAICCKVISENESAGQIFPAALLRCLIYDMMGTLYKAVQAEAESGTLLEELRPLQQKMDSAEVYQMQEIYEEMLERICTLLVRTDQEESPHFRILQIREYIESHYRAASLTVTSLAEQFEMTPVQMSKLFREITGKKILTHLAEVRCLQAEKLLQETDRNVSDIAQETGFGSLRTFLRVFKQITGSTPSQWREENRSE